MNARIWQPSEPTVSAEFYRRVQEGPKLLAARFLHADGSVRTWTRAELWRAAGICAARLEAIGVKPREVCALLFPYRGDIGAWYWGAVRLGAVPAILAYPGSRLHPDKFRDGLRGVARHSGLDVIVTDPALRPQIEPLLTGGTVRTLLAVAEQELGDTAWPDHRLYATDENDVFLLQHSSGTTGLQKAVALSHRAVLAQLGTLAEALALRPTEDGIVSWLPLYHDMGLIAAWLLPFLSGTPQMQLSALDWIARPALFLEVLSKYGGTLAWQPNFAFNFMADRVQDAELANVDLRRVRRLINCAEPVRAAAFDKFSARFRAVGLRPEALAASYALAENVFAVTQTPTGAPPVRLCVELEPMLTAGAIRTATAGGNRAVRECVSSGRAIRGSRIRVLAEDGTELETGRVGELAIQSPYLFDGYRRDGRAVRENMTDGWFRTGDVGFVHEGELYVIGRKKDLLIIRGKNIYPEDIEDCVGEVAGVLPGRVVAYGEYVESLGTETAAVLVETVVEDEEERRVLAAKIRMTVQTLLELPVYRVDFVPPRWLVKSSSGKIARKTNVERWRQSKAQLAPCASN
jgi:acyl-CoA synthetase (AMP-forming)/AMP-acid ligase II